MVEHSRPQSQPHMEKIQFDYGLKNIPIPQKNEYLTTLLAKVESVIKRMRWKAYFPNSENNTTVPQNNKFDLKSRNLPPRNDLLEAFEEDMFKMVENIRFKNVNNTFQNKLKNDIRKINATPKVLVFADKSRNLYQLEKEHYNKLLKENITSDYKLANDDSIDTINQELKIITDNLDISDRIETMPKKQAFITLKDHKENFQNRPKCRLINPAKTNLGRVSKKILERINNTVRTQTKVNQWRNTTAVIEWFKSLTNKSSLSFVIFDIADYYPSISEALLLKALEYAKQFAPITEQEENTIMHARKSLLFDKNIPWRKKTNDDMFDVTMGSFDGAEICELVGLLILDELRSEFRNDCIGLYRDDGLAAFRNMGPRSADKLKSRFIKCFDNLGLKITIETNQTIVNYLDVTFNLRNDSFYPYRKPDNPPIYINVHSNHPPSVIKQVPKSINKRISSLSSNNDEFNKAIPAYNEALKRSGFKEELTPAASDNQPTRNRTRSRKTIWFNPPFSKNVLTNVGKTFLQLIDKHFNTSHPLHKIFNRGNIKVSYSCMNNMASIIKRHNNKILRPTNTPPEPKKICNCRKKDDCPLDGACLTQSLVYQATVVTKANQTDKKIYIGMTENEFKTRYNNHKTSFKHRKHSTMTALSKHIWELKEKQQEYEIQWSILKHANAFQSGSKTCNLCLTEKLCILYADKRFLLNKRSELVSKCRHQNKFLCKYS